MDIVQLDETRFLESLRNPHRPAQIGQDQQRAAIFVFEWLMPRLNDGETRFYIYREEVRSFLEKRDGVEIKPGAIRKVMDRLRKDFLRIEARQFSGYSKDGRTSSAACYSVNPAYLELRPAKASDLLHHWHKTDGHDVRYFSCLSYCWRVGKKGTAANLLWASSLFDEGSIPKVKML